MGRLEDALKRTGDELDEAHRQIKQLEKRHATLIKLSQDKTIAEVLDELIGTRPGRQGERRCGKCGESGHSANNRKLHPVAVGKPERKLFAHEENGAPLASTAGMRELGVNPATWKRLVDGAKVKPFTVNGTPHVRREDLERMRAKLAEAAA